MAKKIFLNKGRVAIVDDDDYEKINFRLWSVRKAGRTSYASSKYRAEDGKLKAVLMHRLVMNVTNSDDVIDHIDHNGLNNQKSNLRVCTIAENCRNKRPNKKYSSRFVGVNFECWRKSSPWRAKIVNKGQEHYLGNFNTEIEAAHAYAIALVGFGRDFRTLKNKKEVNVHNKDSATREPGQSRYAQAADMPTGSG